VAAMASLGNRGRLMKPILVREIVDSKGQTLTRFEPEVVEQVVSPEVAAQIIMAMRRVVSPGGTGERAAVFGYDTCGKTGTAQKVMTVQDPNWKPGGKRARPARRSTYVDKWVASFVGIVPADRPRLAILVVIDEPYMNDYGGVVAAPAFSRVGLRSLTYLNELPSAEQKHETTAHAPEAVTPADDHRQDQVAPRKLPAGVGPARVPDFLGMTVRESLNVAWEARVRLVAKGAGKARSQRPVAGTVLKEWSDVEVRFDYQAPPADSSQEEEK